MEDASGVDKGLLIESLMESIDILRTENDALRRSNKILRTVFRNLRAANDSLRRMVTIAQDNDETFKSFCQGDFDAPVSVPADAGLADAVNTVEPAV